MTRMTPARARVEAFVGEWAADDNRSRSVQHRLDTLVEKILAFHALEMATLRDWMIAYKHHHEREHGTCSYRDADGHAPATLTELNHARAELAEWKQKASRDVLEASFLIAELVGEVKRLRVQLEAATHKEAP